MLQGNCSVLCFAMSNQEPGDRVIATGLDFQRPEILAELMKYLMSHLKVSLQDYPTPRLDGSLLIQIADVQGQSGQLYATRHTVLGRGKLAVSVAHWNRRAHDL